MEKFLNSLVTLDRRIIYLVISAVLIVCLMISLLRGMQETVATVQPPVQNLFDAVAAVPDDKLIILDATFANNTLPENGNQFRALVRHAVLAKKHFAIMALDPQGAQVSQEITEDITGQYGYEYGKDWINFGYQLGTMAFFKPIIQDIPGTIVEDGTEGKPLTPENFPVMKGIKTISDVGLIVEITSSASVWSWIQIVELATKPPVELGYACTGVMAAEAYPLLDAGQICGLMPGLKGAADYEQLVDGLEAKRVGKKPYDPDTIKDLIPKPARVLMFTQNYAHIAVLTLILIGNLAMLFMKLKSKKQQETGNP